MWYLYIDNTPYFYQSRIGTHFSPSSSTLTRHISGQIRHTEGGGGLRATHPCMYSFEADSADAW